MIVAVSGGSAAAAEGAPRADDEGGLVADGPPVGLEPSPMDLFFPDTRARRLSISVDTQRLSPRQEALTTVYPDAPWRFGVAVGAYFHHRIHPNIRGSAFKMGGFAVGQVSGEPSTDEATLWAFPIEGSVEYLFDYRWEQLLIPFVGAGLDAWPWREVSPDATTSGVKWGAHGSAGLILRMNFMETTTHWSQAAVTAPTDAGVKLTVSYAWVNSFGRTGLDFSGLQLGIGGFLAF